MLLHYPLILTLTLSPSFFVHFVLLYILLPPPPPPYLPLSWGDVGYVNRWTMEITNNSRFYSVPLVVGRRIAQIVFFDTDGTLGGRSYADGGKYQTTRDIKELMKNWSPISCLPKMYQVSSSLLMM